MRLKKVEKEKVIPSFSSCITKGYIGDGDPANPLFKIKRRSIASKIEEATGLSEPGQFLRLELSLQLVQDQSPDMVHIDPGPENGEDTGSVQFRHRLHDVKSTDSHFLSLQW